jgi:hypothetical protein
MIRGPAALARELARLPQVASVRLPARAADAVPDGGAQPADAVTLTNLSALSRRGRGVAVAIVDNDFAGIRSALGKSLAGARWIDLTAETQVTLEPAPLPDDRIGRGTQAALAAALAAPEAQLILVRVAADAAHQVISVGRYATGEAFRTDAMSVRYAELLLDNERLRQSRDAINSERRALAEDFSSDEATQQRRLDLQKRLVAQDQQEKAYEQRLSRFIKLEEALLTLGRVGVVACNLNWNTGYAVDGTGPLAAFLDGPARLADRGRGRGALTWLQAAGDTQGQSWAGPWWDADGNGVLEFAPRNFPVPAGKWTRELNFLGWQPFAGSWSAELPAGATYRVTVQWTEAHDTGMAVDPARWRTPLNEIRPVVVRQRDPAGGRTATDDLVVVARPAPLAQMIDRTVAGATYEQTVEFTVDQPGRFAVRLEGRRASSTVPADVTLPPAAVKTGEVFPRVHVQAVDDATRAIGRPIFIDFRSVAGGTATPADAASAVVVGAIDALGRPQAYSARGSAPTLALVTRPTFHAFDEFQFGATRARGTSVANGFAAGTIAAILSAGGPASSDLRWLRIPEAGQLRVPPAWLQQLQHSTGFRERAAYLPSPLDRPTPRNR